MYQDGGMGSESTGSGIPARTANLDLSSILEEGEESDDPKKKKKHGGVGVVGDGNPPPVQGLKGVTPGLGQGALVAWSLEYHRTDKKN